jgi:hypothetical protein
VHCNTFGQIRHSSGSCPSLGAVFKNPKKRAHLAGDSRTVGYSVGLTSIIFMLSTMMSIFDMQ